MDNSTKIVVDNISKCYKMYSTNLDRLKEPFSWYRRSYHTEFFALSNISFSVRSGEIIGIMGRNGSGKSTLLKIITGILTPTCGQVTVSGRVSSLLELGAGFNLEYTGLENIFFYGTLMGFTRNEMKQKLKDIIEFAEIGDYIHQPVKTYSSGMFARLAFSCAVNVEPDVLIVDEILSVGDLRFQAKCFNKFKQFKEKGVTILYVGHDISTMRTFCDRCIWLNSGKIIEEGDPTYISAKYTEFMYLDDINEFTEYKRDIADCQEDNAETQEPIITENDEDIKPEAPATYAVFPDSIAHWGRAPGLIKSINIFNQLNEVLNNFSPYEKVTIAIDFADSPIFDYEFLSVAVSIKNNEGIDLIVKTTFDEDIKIHARKSHHIEFSLTTHLATGEYYLVAALEDRRNAAITYYEYIEGAKYFKIYTSKKIFGIVDIPVEISIDEDGLYK